MPDEIDRTDIELFRQARSGNREAYGALIRGYQQRIFILCYSYLSDYHKAEDLTQETFVKFYESIRRIRDPEKFYYYMLVIAKNLCINELNKKKPITDIWSEESRLMRG
ncbi:MAG: sigma-70 family RNA polymerase sigma factor [Nitrospinae bacterium]|nr:sigma-70 family RNA polymerase sigma factor [Nitrospinota bacterium]